METLLSLATQCCDEQNEIPQGGLAENPMDTVSVDVLLWRDWTLDFNFKASFVAIFQISANDSFQSYLHEL